MDSFTAIVLCGGVGSRLKSVVVDVPKPLAKVNGTPFLDILLKWVSKSENVSSVILAAGYLGNLIESRYSQTSDFRIPVTTIVETEKLGTGGGIRNSLSKVTSEHFMVLNGDSFIHTDLDKIYRNHVASDRDVTFTVKFVSDTDRFGQVILSNENNKILGFIEKHQTIEGGYINCGLYFFKTAWARRHFLNNNFSLEDWFQKNISKHDVGFFATESNFIDIGTPASYLASQSFFNSE